MLKNKWIHNTKEKGKCGNTIQMGSTAKRRASNTSTASQVKCSDYDFETLL